MVPVAAVEVEVGLDQSIDIVVRYESLPRVRGEEVQATVDSSQHLNITQGTIGSTVISRTYASTQSWESELTIWLCQVDDNVVSNWPQEVAIPAVTDSVLAKIIAHASYGKTENVFLLRSERVLMTIKVSFPKAPKA